MLEENTGAGGGGGHGGQSGMLGAAGDSSKHRSPCMAFHQRLLKTGHVYAALELIAAPLKSVKAVDSISEGI